MATSLPWPPGTIPSQSQRLCRTTTHYNRFSTRLSSSSPNVLKVQAFKRNDFDGFKKRMASGELWRDVWRGANNGFEQLVYETRKTAEGIDRRYSVVRRLSSVAQSASDRARELDRDFEITQRWRAFSLDFSINWPRYKKQISAFMDTPIGRSAVSIFFLWFALSGWLFRILIVATWVLPVAGPILIGVIANNMIIKGNCPACKRQFAGNKSQTVRCMGCGNVVWQPKGDSFSRGGGGGGTSSKKSQPDIIDVEFEEK